MGLSSSDPVRIVVGGREPADEAMLEIEASMALAWMAEYQSNPGIDEAALARGVVEDASLHPWRVVDAALDHVVCDACGRALGSGSVGCGPCDLAHGFRFAGREPDRPGVPPGNEHAVRVATAVLRSPHRYPGWAVESNRLFLPLFLAGRMPTRAEQETLLLAARRGAVIDAVGVRSFSELTARAEAAIEAMRGASR